MNPVTTNAELEVLYLAGSGFIFNDYSSGPAGAQFNRLHRADCSEVRKMLNRGSPLNRPTYRKFFFSTLDEAVLWLEPERGLEGQGWKCCPACLAEHTAGGGNTSRTRAQIAGVPGIGHERNAAPRTTLSVAPMADSSFWPVHAAFTMPTSQPVQLPGRPQLASWSKGGDPDQVRLASYLAAADELLRPCYERLTGQLALRLDIGLARTDSLLDQRDLDNYLFPLATHLSQRIQGVFACVWGTKQHSAESFVRIEQAVPAAAAPSFDCCYTIRTSASSQSPEFKQQISDQLSAAPSLLSGPIRMQLSFTVGTTRNWLNLWKPTIDALGQILGYTPGRGPWHPLDGRIVDLGLHCQVDPGMGNEILIVIAAGHR